MEPQSFVIKPEVGRHVHFYPYESQYAFGFSTQGGKPHAAIVAYVHSDICVNLAVFDTNGKTFPVTSVMLRQPGDPKPCGSYCEWMPYTIEAERKRLAAKPAASEADEPNPAPEGAVEPPSHLPPGSPFEPFPLP